MHLTVVKSRLLATTYMQECIAVWNATKFEKLGAAHLVEITGRVSGTTDLHLSVDLAGNANVAIPEGLRMARASIRPRATEN